MEQNIQLGFNDQTIKLLDLIFGQLPISMVVTDKDGLIMMLNDHYAQFLKVKKEDVIGRPVEEVIPNTRLPVVLASGKAEVSQQHAYMGGKRSIVHRIPFFSSTGQVAGAIGIVLFESMEELQTMAQANQALHTKLSAYQNEISSIFKAKYSLDNILGQSAVIRRYKELAKRLASSKANILITGESGTGKELWAHAIHQASERAEFPFVSVNCAAIPENLLETELFGYEEGAFTGAKKGGKLGKFQLANGGTLFLDEIGDMPLVMQVKILRALQEREVERVGGKGAEKVDVRIIAATNRNLEQMVSEGKFRQDLYYRLNVLSLHLPPLREHPEDIGLLVQHFVTKYCNSRGIIRRFAPEALEILYHYSWPGNIRELEAVVTRVLVSTDSEIIAAHDLPANICLASKSQHYDCDCALDRALSELEKDLIKRAMTLSNNSKTEAARLLGISRTRLYRKLEQYGLDDCIPKHAPSVT